MENELIFVSRDENYDNEIISILKTTKEKELEAVEGGLYSVGLFSGEKVQTEEARKT